MQTPDPTAFMDDGAKEYAMQIVQGLKAKGDDTINSIVARVVHETMINCFVEGYRRCMIDYDLIEAKEGNQGE